MFQNVRWICLVARWGGEPRFTSLLKEFVVGFVRVRVLCWLRVILGSLESYWSNSIPVLSEISAAMYRSRGWLGDELRWYYFSSKQIFLPYFPGKFIPTWNCFAVHHIKTYHVFLVIPLSNDKSRQASLPNSILNFPTNPMQPGQSPCGASQELRHNASSSWQEF